MGSHKKHKEHKDHKKKKKHKHRDDRSKSRSRSPRRDRPKRSKRTEKEQSGSKSPERLEIAHKKRKHDDSLTEDKAIKQIKIEPEETAVSSKVSVSRSDTAEDAGAGESLSIEETNKLRAKLGLKPLNVGADVKTENEDEPSYKDRPDVHVPAENLATKKKSSELSEKLTTIKEKKKIHSRLSTLKTLGESDSEDDSASAWVAKSRQISEQKALAEKKAKELQEMDEAFGVGDLLDEEMASVPSRPQYSSKDLRGLTVQHDVDRFREGSTTILTLADKGVLDEEGGDTLVNVNLVDDEHADKNVANKKKAPDYKPWEESEYDEMGMLKHKELLEKYNEEIDGEKKAKFALDGSGNYNTEQERMMAKMRADLKLAGESLATPQMKIATEYLTQEEVSFKKPKKKIRKIRKKQPVLTADDLLPHADEALEADHGSRSRPRRPADDRTDDMDVDAPDLSGERVPDEAETGAEFALERARRLLKGGAHKPARNPEKVAEAVLSRQRVDDEETLALGSASVQLHQTSEFCRTLGEIPTYGQSGNRAEDEDELLDFERQLTAERTQHMEQDEQGGWNEVNDSSKSDNDAKEAGPVLNDEPVMTSGVASALTLATRKGYLLADDGKKKGESRLINIQAKNFQIEDKRFDDIDSKYKTGGRRGGDGYQGPTQDFIEKKDYKPEISLHYIDDIGRVQSEKEAFKYLSYRFHGRGPGKMKTEKKMKKIQENMLLKQMASTDTPLQTMDLLRDKLESAGSAHVVLTGANSNLTGTAIKK